MTLSAVAYRIARDPYFAGQLRDDLPGALEAAALPLSPEETASLIEFLDTYPSPQSLTDKNVILSGGPWEGNIQTAS